MTKFLAIVAMFSLISLNQLGNFYLSYGMWPISWASFVFFTFTSIILALVFDAVRKEL